MRKATHRPRTRARAPVIPLLFEDVGGAPVARLPRRADGTRRVPDGAKYFTLAQAVLHWPRFSKQGLADEWETAFGSVPPETAPASHLSADDWPPILFEDVEGSPVPRLPRQADGRSRTPDGRRYFTPAQAAGRWRVSKCFMVELWRTQCGPLWLDALASVAAADAIALALPLLKLAKVSKRCRRAIVAAEVALELRRQWANQRRAS